MSQTKTILYVEDDADSCLLMKTLLKAEGYEVKTCASSEKGIQLAKEGGLSAIILDHWLASISGVEICRQIRTYDQTTPVIFYSGAAFPQDRQAGIEAGAQAYLVKPSDFGNIVETLKRLIVS
jgi:DNA-binding response OmpR family regulator